MNAERYNDEPQGLPRGTWECRRGHLNQNEESTCKQCERRKYYFDREEEAIDFKSNKQRAFHNNIFS